MSESNQGGRAFPWCGDLNQTPFIELGMTLRDYFAAKAIAGLLADPNVKLGDDRTDKVAVLAYSVADAMLRARGEA
ncbi:hypothetical protein [Burkholderia vietnamiensis]|uniref:hypothetical protein n=1 Tax=Burkholderia vietnamiensis TaxID=60552 RepID=UPI001CF5AB95|nr:hypothetical protein [Burkholderia vietnamiensis]MCA7945605.1 hypothetical protein [Burkholderia vietnamiensis]